VLLPAYKPSKNAVKLKVADDEVDPSPVLKKPKLVKTEVPNTPETGVEELTLL
jgi:hypothetical protein